MLAEAAAFETTLHVAQRRDQNINVVVNLEGHRQFRHIQTDASHLISVQLKGRAVGPSCPSILPEIFSYRLLSLLLSSLC